MQQLSQILTALADELLQIRDGRHDPVALDDSSVKRSEDKDFIYLEAELAWDPCAEIDISIDETRAFIRIERSPAGPHSGDDLGTDLKAMIGWVEFIERGTAIRVILDTDGVWTCEVAPALPNYSNRDYSPVGHFSDNHWGAKS